MASDLCDLSGFLSDVWEWMLTDCDELVGSSDFHAAGALAISAGLVADGNTYADCAQMLDTATNFLMLAGVDINSALVADDNEAMSTVVPSAAEVQSVAPRVLVAGDKVGSPARRNLIEHPRHE